MHKLIIPHAVNMTHYNAGAIVFGCIDDRFSHLLARLIEFLKEEGKYDYVDRVIFAGGAGDLAATGTHEQKALLGQIAKSAALHHTPTIIATTHEDCGAFGEEAKCGGNRPMQFLVHLKRHHEIETAILARYPKFDGRIEHYYLSINGVIKIDLRRKGLGDEETRALRLTA